jgi:hypothetical protein
MSDFTNAHDFPSVLSDTTDLPYAVRARGLELAVLLLFCIVSPALGAFALWSIARAGLNASVQVGVGLVLVAGLALDAYLLIRLFAPWMMLYPDRLERRGFNGWRRMNRADIEGVRTGSDRGGRWFEVVSRLPGEQPIRLRQKVRDDPVVDRWFAGIRDITAAEIAADRAAVLSDPRYGDTTAERQSRLDLATWVTRIAVGAGLAVSAWLFLFPLPPLVVLGVALAAPVLTALIVRASNGLIIWYGRATARPVIGVAAMPLLAAAFKTTVYVHLVDPSLVLWAAGALVLVGCALAFARFRVPPQQILAVAVLGGFIAYGVIALIDVAFDTGKPQTFPVIVDGKRISGGRSTTYYLHTGPWSDRPASDVSVSSGFYYGVGIGSVICFERRPGAIGVGWFEVKICPTDAYPQVAALNQIPSNYPDAAARAGIAGAAVVQCSVIDENRLGTCQVLSETPQGYGFGDAALRQVMSPNSGFGPALLKGRTTIQTTIRFQPGP